MTDSATQLPAMPSSPQNSQNLHSPPAAPNARVVSGMRPTGRLHLGHYHGVLKNWVTLQQHYPCFFFVADWHALTTHYDAPHRMEQHVKDMVIDWLAAGVDPEHATMFIQSAVPEHAELHLLLSMVTPLGWLQRVPSFKDQQRQLQDKDLTTYGFLGYPLLQAADILMYRATHVPVGEDQVPHVELTREIARRFNYMFARPADFDATTEKHLEKLDKTATRALKKLHQHYQQQSDEPTRIAATTLITAQTALSPMAQQQLCAYFQDTTILPEPQAWLTAAAKMPGLDGQKMSKSYGNTIALRAPPDEVTTAIKRMPTDPARVRLTDPGEPEKCPVWHLHTVYSDATTREWVAHGCRAAEFGCLQCKQPLIAQILAEQESIQTRAHPYERNPAQVREIIEHGNTAARTIAQQTMAEIRAAVGTVYGSDHG